MKPKKKIDPALLIGLGIPVMMIVVIAAAIHSYRFLHRVEGPQYDFLYSVGYAQGYRVFVNDGRLRREDLDAGREGLKSPGTEQLQFFIHRVGENTSERLNFERASQLRLDDTALSPDGYGIRHGRKSNFFFPFWSSHDYRTRYLRKKGRAIKLELAIGESHKYAYNVTFLGWIER